MRWAIIGTLAAFGIGAFGCEGKKGGANAAAAPAVVFYDAPPITVVASRSGQDEKTAIAASIAEAAKRDPNAPILVHSAPAIEIRARRPEAVRSAAAPREPEVPANLIW